MSSAPWPRGYRRGRPYQWGRDDLVDLTRWAATQLDGLDARIASTWAHVADWTPTPIPSTAPPSGRVSGGGRNDDGTRRGTGEYVASTTGTDPMARAMQSIIASITTITRQVEVIDQQLQRLAIADADDLSTVLIMRLPPGVGRCVNPACTRWVAGGKDRLRAGRCATCAQYHRRNGHDRDHTHTVEDEGHPTHECPTCARLHGYIV